jgi:signal transduction histidine kinase
LLVKSVKKEVRQREALSVLTDSLQKANTEMHAANIRLEELDRQKNEFLSIASHQLRTPLSIFNGYIELLEEGAYGKVEKKTVEALTNMDETNQRLVSLVDEFLDITRIEQGRTKFVFADVDLVKTVDSVVTELRHKLRGKDKDLVISWQKPEHVCKAVVDEEKIRHVVFNFLDNAIKYSEHGVITVKIVPEQNGFSITVTDVGLGFEENDRVNFFQKFYRGKNVEGINVNGTGLGLYVCNKFIEAHGGKVWATSPGLGKGSEFGLWVPKERARAPQDVPVNI